MPIHWKIARWAWAVSLPLVALPAHAAEKRCGYLENPTPGNWWLTDRDGQWIMGTQGSEPAVGMETMSQSLFGKGWVRTNGSYGHRCACLTVDTDRRNSRITRVRSASPLPMRACAMDPRLRGKAPLP